ncbi:histidine phosphotransferase family protein [Roseicyclus marinus]|uniref:histidine phosphotransferase family protein n=1 Tax=Roseicyclus marinus TaxID=2161673 RepID=UPI00240FF5C6|nr:histidine phosphotransferase family protein [Roseicyclus marinus]MDG3040131.1 histidine phosphotransferase family protein [Roseicyclus marinus]
MNDQSPHGDQTLADLIGSRLCHDLVNPLGAIGNGVELIEMTGSARGPEMALIRDAVRDAQARVRFLRVAFGAAGSQQIMSAREARATALAPWQDSRLTLDWAVPGDLPRLGVKLGYLMLLCAETALPMGGSLRIGLDPSGNWQVTASGPRLSLDEALWSVLRFGMASAGRPLRPSEAQFPALHAAVTPLDKTINYVAQDDRLTIATA